MIANMKTIAITIEDDVLRRIDHLAKIGQSAGNRGAQRAHIASCYHAWLSLKVIAKRVGKTLYQVKADPFGDYLRAQLRNPTIPAYGVA